MAKEKGLISATQLGIVYLFISITSEFGIHVMLFHQLGRMVWIVSLLSAILSAFFLLFTIHLAKQFPLESIVEWVPRLVGKGFGWIYLCLIDILGIGEIFRRRGWNTSHWGEQYEGLKFDIQVKVRILHGQGKTHSR